MYKNRIVDVFFIKVKKNIKNKEEMNSDCYCSICLDVNEKEKYTTLCKHTFHKDCLKEWLTKSTVCPDCKTHIPADERLPNYTGLPNFKLIAMSNLPIILPPKPKRYIKPFLSRFPKETMNNKDNV